MLFLFHTNQGMLIIALDYDYAPPSELTCTKDARTMYRMVGRAGVDDITIITDKACSAVLNSDSYYLSALRNDIVVIFGIERLDPGTAGCSVFSL